MWGVPVLVIRKNGLLHRRVVFSGTYYIPLCEVAMAHIAKGPRDDEHEAEAPNCMACEVLDTQIERNPQGVIL